MQHRTIANYMPNSRLEAVVFTAVMLVVWPLQDFRDRWRF
jgi:hypothetical protein